MLETLGAEETDVIWCDFRTYWIRSQTRPAIQVRPNADHSAGWLGRGARVCIGWGWRYRRGFGWDAEYGMEAQRGCDGAGRTPYELLLLRTSHGQERSQTHSVRMCCRPGRRRPALSGRSCQAKRGGVVIGPNEVTIERKTSARAMPRQAEPVSWVWRSLTPPPVLVSTKHCICAHLRSSQLNSRSMPANWLPSAYSTMSADTNAASVASEESNTTSTVSTISATSAWKRSRPVAAPTHGHSRAQTTLR